MKRAIILSISVIVLFTVLICGYLVLSQLKNTIDPRSSAQEIFSDFKKRALNGEVTSLSEEEENLKGRWDEVKDICISSAKSIANDYAQSEMDYQATLNALQCYKLFKIDSKTLNDIIDEVVAIEDGRKSYNNGLTEKNDVKAAILFSRVVPKDILYYERAKANLIEKLDTEKLEQYVKAELSHNRTEKCISDLNYIEKMSGNQHVSQIIKTAEQYAEFTDNTQKYSGPIEVLTVRNLLAFPEKTYDKNSNIPENIGNSLLTVTEFQNILEQMYKNGYILIRIDNLNAENMYSVDLPAGKKPFAIVIENLSYNDNPEKVGTCGNLTIDENNNLCTVTNGKTSYNNESILVLEEFVNKHPDFTFKGARGIISLTGYGKVFGYAHESEEGQAQIIKIAEHLKESGWCFANNSYAYANMQEVNMQKLKQDTENWDKTVGSLVGPCNIYVWPYGNHVRQGEKHAYLYEKGYTIFMGLGINPFKAIEPDGKGIFFDRRSLTGYALKNYREEYLHLFDSQTVIDKKRGL